MRTRSARAFLPFTVVEFEVLLSLADRDHHGYGLIADIDARTNGQVHPHVGTLYRALNRLLDAGFVAEVATAAGAADDPRRRYYSLTPAGRRAAASEARRLAAQVTAARARKLLKGTEG